ncbi:hypothetical protein K443DRAFT_682721 [Laccaria amethystina LaAM-08-1]|uniref:Unplaced genomic scaffold K443scaffold_206, whole genome shotgun sequence n=1 Tax=Laccaria amethystina LaAM-08-1 TaxID=1095629 RepID=A0A0C9WUE9_9AGAR|nr:hypothetical protein K443DRAFT_682721 [Laccaria amethystina LaAM-08-1]
MSNTTQQTTRLRPPNNPFRQRYQPSLGHTLRKLFKDLLGFFSESLSEDFSAVNA